MTTTPPIRTWLEAFLSQWFRRKGLRTFGMTGSCPVDSETVQELATIISKLTCEEPCEEFYMWLVKKSLIEQHDLPHLDNPDTPLSDPKFLNIEDGEYPCLILGRLDNIQIIDGYISCRNFDEPETK